MPVAVATPVCHMGNLAQPYCLAAGYLSGELKAWVKCTEVVATTRLANLLGELAASCHSLQAFRGFAARRTPSLWKPSWLRFGVAFVPSRAQLTAESKQGGGVRAFEWVGGIQATHVAMLTVTDSRGCQR